MEEVDVMILREYDYPETEKKEDVEKIKLGNLEESKLLSSGKGIDKCKHSDINRLPFFISTLE